MLSGLPSGTELLSAEWCAALSLSLALDTNMMSAKRMNQNCKIGIFRNLGKSHQSSQSPAMKACDVAVGRSPCIETQLSKVRENRGFHFQINAGLFMRWMFGIEASNKTIRPGNSCIDVLIILHPTAQKRL